MRRCKVIARYGVGVDIVDVEAATARGILVTNVRDYCTEEVADHAIALWLALARKLFQYDRATHQGVWHWKAARPVSAAARPRRWASSPSARSARRSPSARAPSASTIVVYDPYLDAGLRRARRASEPVSQGRASRARRRDHDAGADDRRRRGISSGRTEFARMKPGVVIVNTGRGPTIDNKALYDALVAGRVAGAGLDDPEEEPAKRAHWNPKDNPLFSLPNVIVTPHVAYYSEESIRLARETAASEVARVLTGERPKNPVNDVVLPTLAAGLVHKEDSMLKVFNDFERRPDLLAKFDAVAKCYSASCVFADVMYRTGVMDSAIKPPFKAKAVGQAITVQLSKGDLVDPLKALEMGQAGDIIVVDAGGDTETSVCGGLMGGLAKNRGIRGMIVDGAGRDTDELEDIGWPIWTRAITARGTHTMFSGRKEELSINVPIACAGVVVNPGDFIVADMIGVTVVPLAKAEEIVELAREQAEREENTRAWVAKGKTVEDLLAEFGRI